jgi:hypothetical protein
MLPVARRMAELTRHIRLVVVLRISAIAMVAISVHVRAERIEPPLELLHDPVNMLIAGTASEINTSASRVVFEYKDLLSGNPKFLIQKEIDVLVPNDVIARIVVGKKYIVGYALFAEDPHRPGRLMGRHQGATMLVSPGLDPALFADTPEVRKILDLGKSERATESRNALNLVGAALKADDPQLENLAANELALEPALREKTRDRDRTEIEAFVKNSAASPLARAPLLEAAAQHPDVFGREWALDTSRDLISTTPIDVSNDQSEDLVVLVRVAFSLLGQSTANKVPEAALTRWLRSDNTVLIEPALRLVHQQYPDVERSVVQNALDDAATPAKGKEFLRGYLRRMDYAKQERR